MNIDGKIEDMSLKIKDEPKEEVEIMSSPVPTTGNVDVVAKEMKAEGIGVFQELQQQILQYEKISAEAEKQATVNKVNEICKRTKDAIGQRSSLQNDTFKENRKGSSMPHVDSASKTMETIPIAANTDQYCNEEIGTTEKEDAETGAIPGSKEQRVRVTEVNYYPEIVQQSCEKFVTSVKENLNNCNLEYPVLLCNPEYTEREKSSSTTMEKNSELMLDSGQINLTFPLNESESKDCKIKKILPFKPAREAKNSRVENNILFHNNEVFNAVSDDAQKGRETGSKKPTIEIIRRKPKFRKTTSKKSSDTHIKKKSTPSHSVPVRRSTRIRRPPDRYEASNF